jgi:hypothetical protein
MTMTACPARMTVAPCPARGASAFTRTEDISTRPLDEGGLLVSDCGPTPASAWSQVIDKLLALRGLEDDWDGQGAKAPPVALVDSAMTLAQHLRASNTRPADYVIAGVNGTVIFEWHGPAEYLEIEVVAPNQAEGRSVRKGSDTTEQFTLSARS